ncbi:MAG: hypothetical protein GX496_04090, partial [Firmicutes bacterium]|nr:hypothetical protein [Bacillota bacterium]
LEVLWRGRYAIVAVTLMAALAAFAVSRLLLSPVYEASVLLVVESQSPPATSQVAELAAAARLVPLDVRGYQEIVESDAFQGVVAQRAKELFGRGNGYAVRSRVVAQTSLLELTAEAPRADEAARMANEAALLLLQEADRLNRSRLERANALLASQIGQAKEDLDKALQQLVAFTREGPSPDERRSELTGKMTLLADYQKRLAELDVILTTERTKLRELRAQIADEPPRLTLQKALSPEAAVLNDALRQLGVSSGSRVMSLQDEQINPVYVDLRTQLAAQEVAVAGLEAEQQYVQSNIDRLSQEVQRLTSELVTLEARQQEVTLQVETARRTYETAVTQYEAQKAFLDARFGESALTLVRDAPVPQSPSRPRTALNMAVAGLLGLMVSVFGLFVAEMWRQPAQVKAGEVSHVATPRA